MRHLGHRSRAVTVVAVMALALAACGGDDGDDEATTDTETTTEAGGETETGDTETEAAPTETGTETGAAGEVAMGRGVTAEPCPDGNPDRGCIYLGTISDLSVGPFAPLAVPITDGQTAYWDWVNENGGIGGQFDVDATSNIEDAEYNPQVHAESYENIRGEVAAMAHSLGTSQTLAVMDAMEQDSMVSAPMTWWSGWNFNPLIVQSGSSYCVDGMNGVDYVAPDGVETVAVVKFPGDYGEDYAAGVRLAAEAAGVEVVAEIEQVQIAAGGATDATVTELAGIDPAPDAIMLATGPTELGEIAGGMAQQGYQGRWIGASPTYNSALLESPVGPVLEASYIVTAPLPPYTAETEAHAALREAVPDPANDGATFGWLMNFPVRAVLEQAVSNGDVTPEGIAQAATEATVDYMGALPELDLSASPADQMVRTTFVSTPDPEGATGLSATEEFSGDTAANHPFDEPCHSLG